MKNSSSFAEFSEKLCNYTVKAGNELFKDVSNYKKINQKKKKKKIWILIKIKILFYNSKKNNNQIYEKNQLFIILLGKIEKKIKINNDIINEISYI